ncbi:hypothetical protein [Brunnivagina elsteri]|uniref:Uncharacterized protein n=1 Tax=Brunnivagina elsteri CCALA 953 TaxID=987040 RepID=A0A2A2TG34_9CYAN|nr:hypothetical protein [Calothrix elsteri]PAX52692.1 hypothetical protein CK510_17920 [Calothrix elsteri CCALA 953]
MFAPLCSSLLKRKLEIKNIHFIQSDKVLENLLVKDDTDTDDANEEKGVKPFPNWVFHKDKKSETDANTININTADKITLTNIFKGTGIKQTTIERLIRNRENNKYRDLDNLVSDLKFTQGVKAKLQKKVENNEICFYHNL